MMIMAGRQQNPRIVMVRYGELFLKSDPVKYHFIGILLRNIRRALEAAGHSCTFRKSPGKDLCCRRKTGRDSGYHIAGVRVVDVSVCTRVDATPDALRDAAVSLALSRLHPPCRFAVRAKRRARPA